MIIYSNLTRLKNRKTRILFNILNNTPTTATIEWLESDYPDEVYTISKISENFFTIEFYAKSKQFKVLVENEPVKIFETETEMVMMDDLPLNVINNTWGVRVAVPYCDPNGVEIELYSEAGVKLKTIVDGGSTNFYTHIGTALSTVYADSGIVSYFQISKRLMVYLNDTWTSISNANPIYIKVRGVNSVTRDPILKALNKINDNYYGKTYGKWWTMS